MSVYDDASLVLIPSGYKASKLYSVVPSDGTGDLSFSRSTTATRINENGVRETVSINVPRIDFTGGGCGKLLLEPQRTNLYLNSATLSTQNITTTADDYTVAFEGTGTITFSGTYSGSLVGTGASNRVSLTFTTTSGTLTSTISGSCTNGQAELGSYPTSYIPTAGTSVTRTADLSSTSGLSSVIGSEEGVFMVEMQALANDGTNRAFSISDGTTNNRLLIFFHSNSNQINVFGKVANTNQAIMNYTVADTTTSHRVAVRYKLNDYSLWINGVERDTDTSATTFPANTLDTFSTADGNTTVSPFYGKLSEIVLAEYLTDTQMAALTTI
jgi:hypothetical protein